MAAYYLKDLKKFVDFHVEKGASVLAIGQGADFILKCCQPGRGRALGPGDWNGIDPLPELVLQEFAAGVDYVLLVGSIGAWTDIQTALKQLRPICHSGTRIIASYFNFLWAPVLRLAQLLRLGFPRPTLNWLSVADVRNLFSLSGYRVLKTGHRCVIPVNLGPLSYVVNRFISPLPVLGSLGFTEFVIARLPFKQKREEILVSIIIPARNEKGNIEPAVQRLAKVAEISKLRFELVFVEGNSNDGTYEEICRVTANPELAKSFPISVHQQAGKGKGDAVRLGFAKAAGDFLIILDADLTVPPEDLPKFVDVYCEGYGEFINGSRLVYEMERAAMRLLNLIANKGFGLTFTWLLGQKFKDTLCGTKAVSRSAYARIAAGRIYFGDFDPFGDFDLIFGASKLDLEIVEVPVRYKDRTYGQTNISRWLHGTLLLRMCIYATGRIKFVP